MIEALRSFFSRHVEPRPTGATPDESRDRLSLAACALLLEMAHADDEFSAGEREHIERSMAQHFALDPARVGELIRLAEEERRTSHDLHQFTSLILQHYDEGQRLVLAELLWRVVYADGEVSKHEDYLSQKLSRLLELRPGFLAEARRRATNG